MFPNCKYTVHTKLEWNVLSFFETIHKSTPLSLCPFCRLWPPCVFIYQYNLFASNFCRFLIHMLYVFHKACFSHPRILIVLHRHVYKYRHRDIFLTPKNFETHIEKYYQKYFRIATFYERWRHERRISGLWILRSAGNPRLSSALKINKSTDGMKYFLKITKNIFYRYFPKNIIFKVIFKSSQKTHLSVPEINTSTEERKIFFTKIQYTNKGNKPSVVPFGLRTGIRICFSINFSSR